MLFSEKISAKEHYLLRLLTHLVRTYYTQIPVSISAIAAQERISKKYLEKLVWPFKQASWLKATRGREGGYVMRLDPRRLSLQDVATLVQGDSHRLICLKAGGKQRCSLQSGCPSKSAWLKLATAWEKTLRNIKLSELLK